MVASISNHPLEALTMLDYSVIRNDIPTGSLSSFYRFATVRPGSSVESLAEKLRFPNDFIAAGPLRPSPLTGVRYQPFPDEVLDCCLNCKLYLGRVCRPVFSCHINFPLRWFDCHPGRLLRSRSIFVASRSHWRVAATSA